MNLGKRVSCVRVTLRFEVCYPTVYYPKRLTVTLTLGLWEDHKSVGKPTAQGNNLNLRR
jgi:hypothetical protein